MIMNYDYDYDYHCYYYYIYYYYLSLSLSLCIHMPKSYPDIIVTLQQTVQLLISLRSAHLELTAHPD